MESLQVSADARATQQHRTRILSSVFVFLGVMMLMSVVVVKTASPAALISSVRVAAKSMRPAFAKDPMVQFQPGLSSSLGTRGSSQTSQPAGAPLQPFVAQPQRPLHPWLRGREHPSITRMSATAAGGEKSLTSYKLCYFDIRGVAETARMLFAISKTPYEDCRFSLTFGTPGDFSTIQRPEFDAAKAAGELDVSLGKVPYLEVNGKKFGQSKAIERYLAKQFGMMGEDDYESAVIDQLCESVIDFKNAFQRAKGKTDEAEKDAAVKKFFDEDLPANMKLAEKSLPASAPGPWMVGGKVSLADVVFYQFLLAPNGFFDNAEAAKASFQDCPRIKAALEAVDAIPELKEYIAGRPERPF